MSWLACFSPFSPLSFHASRRGKNGMIVRNAVEEYLISERLEKEERGQNGFRSLSNWEV